MKVKTKLKAGIKGQLPAPKGSGNAMKEQLIAMKMRGLGEHNLYTR